MSIELLAQGLLNGFTLALVYVLVALGLTLIFSIFEIINFAHGEFYMLGGYVTYFGLAVAGLPYLLTLLLGIVVVGLVGLVAERLIFRHLRGKTLNAFIVSLCLLWVLQAGAQLFAVSPAMGALPVVKAFIMIIIGGMGSLPGAVLGGLLLGTVEGLGSLFFSSAAVNVLGFLMVIAVLLVRPRGLFGAA